MIEYYNDIPETHHEIGALDYMRFTGAPYLASVHSKLKSHKDNERVHITDEERDKWNHKVDKTTFYELENKVLTKAEKKEIPLRLSQLQNDVPYLTSADINIKLNSENYITKGDLDSKGYITSNDLSRYATKDYVDNRGYLTQPALANYVTNDQLRALDAKFTAEIAAIAGGRSIDLSNYYTKYDIDGKLTSYALKSYVDNAIEAATIAPIDLSNYYTKDQVNDKIRTAIDSIVIDTGDTDITERIVRTWIDEAYSDAEEDIKNEVLNSSELEDKITLIAGEKIETEGGMTQAQIAALQLASDRAALLVETINGNEVIKSAGIVAAINANNDSAVKINADHIILSGQTIADKIKAQDIELNGIVKATNAEIKGKIEATEGILDNVTITNATITGTLNYDKLLGNTQSITTNNQTIPSTAYFVKVDIPYGSSAGYKNYVSLPATAAEGQTLFVYTASPYVTIRPASGTARIGWYERDASGDEEISDGSSTVIRQCYRWKNASVTSSSEWQGNIYESFYNLIEGSHEYIYAGGSWYEISDFSHKTQYIQQ